MSTKLSTVLLFLFIGIFASLEDAPRVFAVEVLYESYEIGGEKPVWYQYLSANLVLIGSFTVPARRFFDNNGGVFIGADFKNTSGYCHNNAHARYAVSSSTASTASNALWASDAFYNSGTDYVFTEKTSTSGDPGVWLLPGHTYGIYLNMNCGSSPAGNNAFIRTDPLNLIYYGFLSWDGNYRADFDSQAGLTRVISSVPVAGSTVATSTSFVLSTVVEVHELDYTDDTYIRFRYVRNQDLQAVVANSELLWKIIDVPLFNSGIISTSTVVSIIETGVYTYKVQIRDTSLINQILTWFGLNNLYDPTLLAEKSSTFTVVAPTALDLYVLEVDDLFNNPVTGILNDPGLFASTTENCASLSFSITGCLTALFIPSFEQMKKVASTTSDLILEKAPVGYITRSVEILTTTATSSLPIVSYTFGSSSPFAGQSFGFNFNGIIASSSVIINNLKSDRAEPKSIFEIVSPAYTVVAYTGLLFMILFDILGISTGGRGLSRKT